MRSSETQGTPEQKKGGAKQECRRQDCGGPAEQGDTAAGRGGRCGHLKLLYQAGVRVQLPEHACQVLKDVQRRGSTLRQEPVFPEHAIELEVSIPITSSI